MRRNRIDLIDGHSQDTTYDLIEQAMKMHPEWKSRLYKQQGMGKANAVQLGFEKPRGDIVMILDSDLTVPPEDLPRFCDALISGNGEFINGVRLVYPIEKQAMQLANLIGIKLFGLTNILIGSCAVGNVRRIQRYLQAKLKDKMAQPAAPGVEKKPGTGRGFFLGFCKGYSG